MNLKILFIENIPWLQRVVEYKLVDSRGMTQSDESLYTHHIKFNNSKLDEEMSQIENQLKNLSSVSNFISKIPLFEEEFE